MTNATTSTATFIPVGETFADYAEYVYECSCGELYKMAAAALCCRKCRNDCAFGYCTHVVDTRTGEVVAGTEPTAAEYEEAQALAEARWTEEQAEYQLRLQLDRQEAAEADVAAANVAMDNLYVIQDEQSGY